MAIGCIKALRRHGYRIPGDIAVAGFDNDPITAHLEPALTTVEQPMQLIGEEAASLLIHKIHEPGSPNRDIMLETRLIIRESA
jgi:DNA-binding LacI/PurR family transcriptional regulator